LTHGETASTAGDLVVTVTPGNGVDGVEGEAVEAFVAALKREGAPHRFSDEAVKELIAEQAGYVRDLGLEAIKIARFQRIDDVTQANIVEAAGRLRLAKKKLPWFELLGSLTGGAAIQDGIDVFSKDPIPRGGAVCMMALSLLTFAFFLAAIIREKRN
jgi:hypothetical protein